MKILLLTAEMQNGGAETHVYELARSLVGRGHTVELASSGGRLALELEKAGVKHHALPLGKKSLPSLVKCYRALMRIVKKGDFDVLHAHSRIAALVAWWVSKRTGVRLVTTVHACFRSNRVLHGLSRWGSAVIAVSYDLGDYLLEHGKNIPVRGARVIPNGVDTERFCPAKNGRGDGRRIVFISRLDSDCSAAAYALLSVCEELWRRYGDVEIVIGGGGSELARIKETAKQKNALAGRELVRVLGEVTDTAELLRSADVFVGVSRAALEAMSCAVPTVLAGNEGFLGVAEGDTLCVAERSNFCCRGCSELKERALLGALCDLLARTDEQRAALGKSLREYVVKSHSAEKTCEQTEQVYRSVMGHDSGARRGVLLCGYYGYGNMGDDALLLGAIRRARECFGDTPLCALTCRGRRDGRRFGIRCESRRAPIAVLRELRRADTVVFGGGTLLQNTTSRRSLRYYLFLLRYAKRRGKRVELWANGIDRINGESARYKTARALSQCDSVGLRDVQSFWRVGELASEYKLGLPETHCEPDLALGAFDGEQDTAEQVFFRLGIQKDAKTAVVALRGVEGKGYIKAAMSLVQALSETGFVPVFVAMYPKQDLKLCRQMSFDCGGVLAYPLSPVDVLSLMRRSAVVCGMRYHALVFAYSVGVPFIGFGAEPKIQSFCNSHGGVYFTDLL